MSITAGLDIGTSGGRCLLLGDDGTVRATARRAWTPRTDDTGFPIIDAEQVLAALTDALDEASAAAGARPDAIGVTSQRTGVVFCDDEGAVLFASPNADGRALNEGIALERAHGETFYRIAGRLPAMLYLPARWAWLRANRPDVAARVATASSIGDWVVRALTGAHATDPTQAAETLLFDVAAGAYAADLLAIAGVPAAILPQVHEPFTHAGHTRDGVPVVCAGADTQCAMLGAGVVETGTAAVVAGTTILCDLVTGAPEPDPNGALWCSPHAVPGRWVREAHCGEAGAAVRWLADLLAIDDEQVAILAAQAQPGAAGVVFVDTLPSTARDFTLVRRGGFAFPVPLLALGRGRADMARALLEGIAFGACEGLALLGARTSVTVTGGVARTRVFAEAIAGVLDEQVVVPADPAASTARGAAIAAAVSLQGGAGIGTLADAGAEVAPDPAHGYPAVRATWRAHADALGDGTMRMSDLMR